MKEYNMARNKVMLTESQLHKVIVNSISKVLKEVRYIDTSFTNKNSWRDLEHQEPIKNEERIRVFHGCDLKDAVIFAKHGLSGKEQNIRKYSYEQGMNPIGLFVSTSFETVKEFSNPFGGPKDSSKTASVILEFTAKATDLDTPVWNNSETYFGQGSNPMPFKNKDERDAQKKHYNDNAKNDEHEYVRNSDNPAMASNIFDNREHQALFIGDLSPNMIKRFWVKRYANGTSHGPTDKQYTPMNRNEFLKEFGNAEFYIYGTYDQYKPIQHSQRLFNPNEDFTSIEDMADRQIKYDLKYRKKFVERCIDSKFGGNFDAWYNHEYEELINDYKDCIKHEDAYVFKQTLWPKQIYQLFGKDIYNKNFDRFGIGFPS